MTQRPSLHHVHITRAACLLSSFLLSPPTPRPKWQGGSECQALHGQAERQSWLPHSQGPRDRAKLRGRYSPGRHEHQLFLQDQEGQLLPKVGKGVGVKVEPFENKVHPASPNDGQGLCVPPNPQPSSLLLQPTAAPSSGPLLNAL